MCLTIVTFVWILEMIVFLVFFRDSDKMIFERLQKEFEAARAAQTEGSQGCITGVTCCKQAAIDFFDLKYRTHI